MVRIKKWISQILLATMLSVSVLGCGETAGSATDANIQATEEWQDSENQSGWDSEQTQHETESKEADSEAENVTGPGTENASGESFRLSDVPAYSGSPYVVMNQNNPYFTEEDLQAAGSSFEEYSDLDVLGRCGVCTASVGTDIMPTEERGSIGSVKPTGWHTVKYDFVDGKYLYNRCHLLGYQLTGENANEKNLITGTRYLNVDGMLPFENMVADYVKETNQHVLYRVTPVFEGDNLVADGVLMEGKSVEDDGEGILFCVFAYNVQPGVTIDYATGESTEDGTGGSAGTSGQSGSENTDAGNNGEQSAGQTSGQTAESGSQKEESAQNGGISSQASTYILNTNTMKFHRPDCSSVKRMSEKNKAVFEGTRDEAISAGYSPCENCNP